jgi:hypothetical protein
MGAEIEATEGGEPADKNGLTAVLVEEAVDAVDVPLAAGLWYAPRTLSREEGSRCVSTWVASTGGSASS